MGKRGDPHPTIKAALPFSPLLPKTPLACTLTRGPPYLSLIAFISLSCTMDDTSTSSKRSRPAYEDDESPSPSPSPSPEVKRARRVSAEDYLLTILDEDDSPASQEVDDGLASVMHSLEQEIASGVGSQSALFHGDKEASVQDLGYLLEASDDELGLPPAADDDSPAALARDVAQLAGAEGADMYGLMWGFDDDAAFGSDFGFRPDTGDDAVAFDDVGLFDHSEPSDLAWRTMPAV